MCSRMCSSDFLIKGVDMKARIGIDWFFKEKE